MDARTRQDIRATALRILAHRVVPARNLLNSYHRLMTALQIRTLLLHDHGNRLRKQMKTQTKNKLVLLDSCACTF